MVAKAAHDMRRKFREFAIFEEENGRISPKSWSTYQNYSESEAPICYCPVFFRTKRFYHEVLISIKKLSKSFRPKTAAILQFFQKKLTKRLVEKKKTRLDNK